MALTATIYNLDIDLADIDRGIYERLHLRVARQPSETIEYMLMRVFAYCLEYADGIALTEGVAAGGESGRGRKLGCDSGGAVPLSGRGGKSRAFAPLPRRTVRSCGL